MELNGWWTSKITPGYQGCLLIITPWKPGRFINNLWKRGQFIYYSLETRAVYLLFPGNQGGLLIIPWKPGRFINNLWKRGQFIYYSLETRAVYELFPGNQGCLLIINYSLETRAVYFLFPGNQGGLLIIPWKPGLLWAPDCACSAPCLFGSPTWKILFMKHLCPESRDKLIDYSYSHCNEVQLHLFSLKSYSIQHNKLSSLNTHEV